ncbi:MAG: DUF4214 domain-containing protein [Lachnospiraceae bacterium]|nr:DUF4214 domain-containing protein [Lachnospiraceae bacterium]
MKNFVKKFVNSVLIFALLLASIMPNTVNAASVNRIGASKVGSIVMAYTGGNSQVYVNKITQQNGTEVRYVYSQNFIVTPESILDLKSVLEPEYSSLIPDDYTNGDDEYDVGIKVCSDASLVDSMDDYWTSSEWVATNVIAPGANKVTIEDGDGINETEVSNTHSLTALFNKIKDALDAENIEKWKAIEQARKESWDAAEAQKHEEDPSYIPQEYVGSEYVPLDYGTFDETDIQNVKTLEDNQIAISLGATISTSYQFNNGKLEEVSNATIVNHVPTVYTEHTIIGDTGNITKINSLNIQIASPKVLDAATETTKPTVTLDTDPNYEIDYIAYITAYPSEKEPGEYDAPFIGTFEAGKDYVVEVSLVAKDGFAFADNDGMTLTVNGKTTGFEKNEWNADGSTYYMFYAKVQATAEETPTKAPTTAPTEAPTEAPTKAPTETPTEAPTTAPGAVPTQEPPSGPVVDFVNRVYVLLLDRDPSEDPDGVNYWTNILKANNKDGAPFGGARLVQYFIVGESGKEYASKKKSNDEFLLDMYAVLMGRNRDTIKEEDAGGFAYWMGRLDAGEGREHIMKSMANCPEFVNICDNAGIKVGDFVYYEYCSKYPEFARFVARMYTKAMGRSFDGAGLEYWVSAIVKKEQSIDSLSAFFFNCDEFVGYNLTMEEKVKRLYRTFFDREAENNGLVYWLLAIENGSKSWKDAYSYFIVSDEFKGVRNKFGL